MPFAQLFAKPPLPGKVKTRLQADIGAKKATEVYRFCLFHILQVLNSSQLSFEVWLTENSNDPLFTGLDCQIQQGGNLGERMYFALSQSLTRNPHAPVILVGSDCLDIKPSHIKRAMQSLASHELVFLPCVDGGFAMIGCRRIDFSLFDQVAWSTDSVLQQTLNNAEALNYRVDLLETVRDIDTLQDLDHYPELCELIASP